MPDACRRRSVLSLVRAGSHGLAPIAFALLAAAGPLAGQTVDVTPPMLADLDFSPTSVDVSSGPQTVTVTMHVTDDLSGVGSIYVSFYDAATNQYQQAYATRTAGNTLDGTWTADIVIPQLAADGIWTLNGVTLQDFTGNYSFVSEAVLTSRGFPTQLTVTSIPDTQAPTVVGISMTPPSVDASAADQFITLELDLDDDASGVAFSDCSGGNQIGYYFFPVTMRSPSGAQNRFLAAAQFSLTAGTALSGTWEATLPMPRYSESGTWTIQSLQVRDCAGNFGYLNTSQLQAMGLQTDLHVTSSPADVQVPDLVGLSFQPIAINTSTSNQFVTVMLHVTDDLAGAAFTYTTPVLTFFEGGVNFTSPSGNQSRSAFGGAFTLVSGTALDGVWQGQIYFPQFSEDGTWAISQLSIKDAVRNIRTYDAAGLQALGFPTALEVIRPSLISDGTVDAGGGTVLDDTFGPRAAVIVPAGVLTVPTDVAIDVLPNPLGIPNPTGFQGPGTLFVNIDFSPTPAFPLPAPGLTIVLPLPDPLPAGTALNLYKVDPATGNLVPEQDVFGMGAVGYVAADGLSATFTGVASLSTIVGLIPDAIAVAIDIKPGSPDNPINLGAKGSLPVAILGSSTFDAATVDPETVALAGAVVARRGKGMPQAALEDVNGDGWLDMVLHFDIRDLQLLSNDVEADLTGLTQAGIQIIGHDAIRIVR